MTRQRKPYHHGDLRRALIQTGLSIIDREGLQALSIRRLASEVGVSHTAPIYHFANKDELVAAIATEGFRIYNETVAPILEIEDPRERFIELGRRYFGFASAHSAYYRLIFGPAGDVCESETDDLSRESERSFESLLRTVGDYLDWYGISRDESRIRMTSILVWSHVHGTVMLWFNSIWAVKFPNIDRVVADRGYLEAFRPMVENTLEFLADNIRDFAAGDVRDWKIPGHEDHVHPLFLK